MADRKRGKRDAKRGDDSLDSRGSENPHDFGGPADYRGAEGKRERSTPGREASRLVPDEAVRRGLNPVGQSDIRNGALRGNTGNMADIGPGPRTNPPVVEGAGYGDGGTTMSGGVAGGTRAHSGTDNHGAGSPDGDSLPGPAEYKSTSRGDLDR